ncbi:MAG: hypothetical protein ABIN89_22510 [Chitinophagaceae bacterium]
MSFLKNIMSPFLEFKEEENKPVSKEGSLQNKRITNLETSSEPGKSDISSSTTSSRSTGSSGSGTMGDYQKYFEDLIEEANAKNPIFQGTDFKEFIDSKIDVEAIADEATRYKTAFNVLKRTGLTKEKLVSTGHEYIHIIERDLQGFVNAYAQQYKKDVEQKELLLQKKAEELQAINEKIKSLNQEIKDMSSDITQSKEKLNNNKESFVMAGDNKKKEIEIELQKIDQYF